MIQAIPQSKGLSDDEFVNSGGRVGLTDEEFFRGGGATVDVAKMRKATAPAPLPDPSRDKSALQLIPESIGTLAGTLGPAAVHTVEGAAAFPIDLMQHPISTLADTGVGLANSIVNAPQSIADFVKAAGSGDTKGMAQGTSDFITKAAPAILGVKEIASGVMGGAGNLDRAGRIRQRAIQSILKPNKAAFDFGADPVTAVMETGPASDIYKLQKNVRDALTNQEAMLQDAIKTSPSIPVDVEPQIRAQAQPILEQSLRWGKNANAKSIAKSIDAYIADLRARRGTTLLSPADVLEEKRFLSKEVKFKPSDVASQNLNALKMGVYRALDGSMDSMVPSAKAINQKYSGLIEADHLLKQRILERGNADLTKQEFFGTIAGAAPDVSIKTRTAAALKPSPLPVAAAKIASGATMAAAPSESTSDTAVRVIGGAITKAEDYIRSKFPTSKKK